MKRILAASVATGLLATVAPSAAIAESSSTAVPWPAGAVTEKVEPGVLRVVHDGVRALEVPDAGSPNSWLSIDPDGGIWVFGENVAYELGAAPTYDWDHIAPWTYEFAADGTLWGTTFEFGHLVLRWPVMDRAR